MRRASSIFFLLSALATGACGPVFRTPLQADQEAKLFAPPPPGLSGVYIYRDSSYAPRWPIKVHILDSVNTELPAGTYLRVDLQPGLSDISCITNALSDHRRTPLVAGEVRYFQVRINPGSFGVYCLVVEVAPEAAQAVVRTQSRVEPINP
jgi:hypothetical protein